MEWMTKDPHKLTPHAGVLGPIALVLFFLALIFFS